MKLQVNEGPLDRLIRLVAGVTLFAIAASGAVGAPVLYGVLLVGTIALFTGATGFCLAYVPFGISTVPKRQGTASAGR